MVVVVALLLAAVVEKISEEIDSTRQILHYRWHWMTGLKLQGQEHSVPKKKILGFRC